jgi:hypothetical protein
MVINTTLEGFMKSFVRKSIFFIVLIFMTAFLFAENIPAEKLVFAKSAGMGSIYVNSSNEVIPLKEAVQMFSECPENAKVLKAYTVKNTVGGILTATGLAAVAGSSIFYLVANVIMSKDYDWSGYTISMAAGSLSLCTGLFSLLLAGRDVQTAHTNYNLYVMGIPIK